MSFRTWEEEQANAEITRDALIAARDQIVNLRLERDGLRLERDGANAEIANLCRERDALIVVRNQANAQIVNLRLERDGANAEIANLCREREVICDGGGFFAKDGDETIGAQVRERDIIIGELTRQGSRFSGQVQERDIIIGELTRQVEAEKNRFLERSYTAARDQTIKGLAEEKEELTKQLAAVIEEKVGLHVSLSYQVAKNSVLEAELAKPAPKITFWQWLFA